MSDTVTPDLIGDNARERLAGFARQISDELDAIAEAQEKVKELKAEAKAIGFDMKALGQIIKEMRKGPKYQAAQLELELVLDTYRGAVNLPRTLEQAQEAAHAAAEQVPEKPARRKKADNDDGDETGRQPSLRKDLN